MSVKQTKGILHLDGMTADHIAALLESHHAEDVFVPQCKTGETWSNQHLGILDAWVLLRTYSPLTTIGYEVKVSRQDFEQDQKWTSYLPYCHLFSFVCPAGLIRAADLPGDIGIIWVSQSGKLHTKRRPSRHEPDAAKLQALMIYVLMSRSKICSAQEIRNAWEPTDKLTLIREMVETAAARQELAFFVKGHVKEVQKLQGKRAADLEVRENRVRDFASRLAQLGITWDSTKAQWHECNEIGQEIAKLREVLDPYTLQAIRQMGASMQRFADMISKYHQEVTP